MYLPKSKYKEGIARPGQYTLDGKEYLGNMFTDYKGNAYAGKSPSTVIGRIYPYAPAVDKSGDNIVPIKRVPTENEYIKGSMVRYFRQDRRTKKIDEIERFPESGVDTQFTYGSTNWLIRGQLNDKQVMSGRYSVTCEGIRTKNNKAIDELEKVLPGLRSSGILSDPAEFVKEYL